MTSKALSALTLWLVAMAPSYHLTTLITSNRAVLVGLTAVTAFFALAVVRRLDATSQVSVG